MSFSAVVLAAGRGTRMRSARPKVLHPVAGRPMIVHVLDAVSHAAGGVGVGARPVHTAIVVGYAAGDVRSAVTGHLGSDGDAAADGPSAEADAWSPRRSGDAGGGATPEPEPGTAERPPSPPERTARLDPVFAVQAEQLGTGHAALQARAALSGKAETVLILCGDTPLITGASLERLLRRHARSGAVISFVTMRVSDPAAYGRVVRDGAGRVRRIVEARHLRDDERAIDEVNTGVYAVSDAWLWPALEELAPSPGGEVYLTDLVAAAAASGSGVETVAADAPEEFIGVDTRARLAEAEAALRDRIRRLHMDAGVTLVDPASTWIDAGVTIGRDTEIWPGSYLLGGSRVGEGCRIGPGALLRDSDLGSGASVIHSVLEGARVGAGVHVGPYSHLRPGADVEAGAHVGNFAEIKNARLGAGARMGHFGYLGDASVAEGANIGAGTVTCNFDGAAKHRTVIGRGAFIGSDTMLVAPVTIGDGARTGAGSVVNRDVAPGVTVAGVPARVLGGRSDRGADDAGGPEPPDHGGDR